MEERASTPENAAEKFREITLEIKEPDGIHQLEIIFDETDTKLVTAYNLAINEVCNKQNNLGMFHQTGRGNEPGYHAWEILGSSNDRQRLSELLASIHREAGETYSRLEDLNIF